jgi:hypothetical protein
LRDRRVFVSVAALSGHDSAGFMQAKAFRQRTKIRLGNLAAVRAELCTCYRAWVANQIDAEALRAGSLALQRIAALDQGQLLEQRVERLEERLAEPAVKPNGGSYHARP